MIDVISQVMYLDEQALLPAQPARVRWVAWGAGSILVGLMFAGLVTAAAAQGVTESRLREQLEEASRREAGMLVELVDRVAAGQSVPSDLVVSWHHDFLKAQPGTFVPFVVTVDGVSPRPAQALLYVRAARKGEPSEAQAASEPRTDARRYAFDAVFPVELSAGLGKPARITRGFAVPAGEYDVFVAVRERPSNPLEPGQGPAPRVGFLRRSLSVPDYWSGRFSTSTVMLAHRIEALARSLDPEEALERPYAIGLNEVEVALDGTFRRDRELIVVFVIYNPRVQRGGQFDVRVDYEVFHRPAGAAEAPADRYVIRTSPQRFNLRTIGAQADPAAGHPVMAGQGILLSSFEAGEYRLGITITDLVSGEKLARDVRFRVIEGSRQ